MTDIKWVLQIALQQFHKKQILLFETTKVLYWGWILANENPFGSGEHLELGGAKWTRSSVLEDLVVGARAMQEGARSQDGSWEGTEDWWGGERWDEGVHSQVAEDRSSGDRGDDSWSTGVISEQLTTAYRALWLLLTWGDQARGNLLALLWKRVSLFCLGEESSHKIMCLFQLRGLTETEHSGCGSSPEGPAGRGTIGWEDRESSWSGIPAWLQAIFSNISI